MRLVSACTRRTSASCSSVVTPGLSTMTSLPWRIASTARGPRSFGMEALTTRWMEESSRISRSLLASFAWGYRLEKAAARSGSFAKNGVHLPVDVAVIQADGGEADACGFRRLFPTLLRGGPCRPGRSPGHARRRGEGRLQEPAPPRPLPVHDLPPVAVSPARNRRLKVSLAYPLVSARRYG